MSRENEHLQLLGKETQYANNYDPSLLETFQKKVGTKSVKYPKEFGQW